MAARSIVVAMAMIALGWLSACRHENRNYCAMAPQGFCASPDLCIDDTCVECTEANREFCAADQPTCVEHVCGCTHDLCESGLCLPEQRCAATSAVAHVASDGAGDDCTFKMPCTLAAALATKRPYIVVSGMIATTATIAIAGTTNVTLIGRGATISPQPQPQTSPFDAFAIGGRASVALQDIAVHGANGIGIRVGDDDAVGPNVTLSRVTLAGNTVGLDQRAGEVVIQDSTIRQSASNGITLAGGTLAVSDTSITGSGNTGFVGSGGKATFSGGEFSSNPQQALVSTGGELVVNDTTFSNNGAPVPDEAAVEVANASASGSATFASIRIVNNEGDGFQLTNGQATLDGCVISANNNIGANIRAGELTITRSTVEGNMFAGIWAFGGTLHITNNRIINQLADGIHIGNADLTSMPAPRAEIVGNLIARNAQKNDDPAYGVRFERSDDQSILEFNTIVANGQPSSEGRGGVSCDATAPRYTLRNNIVSNNLRPQIGSTCPTSYTVVFPDVASSGNHNISADPQFVGKDDFHLGASSPARCGADPAQPLSRDAATDLEGTQRRVPADIGAYAYAGANRDTCP